MQELYPTNLLARVSNTDESKHDFSDSNFLKFTYDNERTRCSLVQGSPSFLAFTLLSQTEVLPPLRGSEVYQ